MQKAKKKDCIIFFGPAVGFESATRPITHPSENKQKLPDNLILEYLIRFN